MIEIISYWFFAWFLLFIIGIIKSNPFWILVISYIITIMEYAYLKHKGANFYNLTKFMIINIILKFIPILIILIIMKFKVPFNINDLIIAFILVFIYLITMIIFNINPIIAYQKMLNTYINDDNKYRTYISRLYDDLYLFWNPFSTRI